MPKPRNSMRAKISKGNMNQLAGKKGGRGHKTPYIIAGHAMTKRNQQQLSATVVSAAPCTPAQPAQPPLYKRGVRGCGVLWGKEETGP